MRDKAADRPGGRRGGIWDLPETVPQDQFSFGQKIRGEMEEKKDRIKGKGEKPKKPKKQMSLQRRVLRISLIGTIVLGTAALLIGLGIYAVVLADQYITKAFNLSKTTAVVIEEVVDVEPLAEAVSSIYLGMTGEERRDPADPAYLERFREITEREDYKKLVDILREYRDMNDVSDLYLVKQIRDTAAGIYIADPEEDPELACPTGFWEESTEENVEKFLNWNGEGKLYAIGYVPGQGWIASSGVPFRNADGEVICYIMADVSIRELLVGMRTFVIWYFLALVVIMTVYILLVMRIMKGRVIRPINLVADAAKKYASDKLEGVEGEEHFTNLGIDSGDEIENLADTMAGMEKDLGEYVDHLMKVTKEKERIGAELSVATEIQAGMLPMIFPAFPDRSEFDLYASMTPAKEVGGDFYDFFFIDDDHLALVMADVSGKGVPAALFMVIAKTLIKDQALMGELSPGRILMQTNERLCESNTKELFVTVWLAILNVKTGEGMAANAGHEHPALRRAGEAYELQLYKHSPAVATMEGMRFREHEFVLHPGDSLFVYTDGVAEATNARDELYGTDRMIEALNEDPDASPEEVLVAVKSSVDRFVADAPQFDDLTMLCLRYNGSQDAE